MSNGRSRRTTRKIDAWAVYDALPSPIRAALQEGPQEWDAVWCHTTLRRLARNMPVADAVTRVAKEVNRAHAHEIAQARPWQIRRNMPKLLRLPSPHVLAQATMQTSGRPTP